MRIEGVHHFFTLPRRRQNHCRRRRNGVDFPTSKELKPHIACVMTSGTLFLLLFCGARFNRLFLSCLEPRYQISFFATYFYLTRVISGTTAGPEKQDKPHVSAEVGVHLCRRGGESQTRERAPMKNVVGEVDRKGDSDVHTRRHYREKEESLVRRSSEAAPEMFDAFEQPILSANSRFQSSVPPRPIACGQNLYREFGGKRIWCFLHVASSLGSHAHP